MKSRFVPALAAAAVMCPMAWCQQGSELHARELFYTPPPDSSKPAPAAASATPPRISQAPASPAPKAVPTRAVPPKTVAKAPTPAESVPVQRVVATAKPPASGLPLGLRYSVLKRDESGRYVEVDPDMTFHSGDRIRLQVQSNTTGHLYVVMQGSSGVWRLLFPSSEVAGGDNRIASGDTRQIPPGDRGQFLFDEQAGVEKLFVVLSRQPEPDLDKLIYAISGTDNGSGGGGSKGEPNSSPSLDAQGSRTMLARASVSDDVVARLRQEMLSRDLVFEKVEGNDVKAENAAYVVNPSSAPDARLVVDIKLVHK